MKAAMLGWGLVLCAVAGSAGAAVDLGQFIRKDNFNEIRLSPTGKYYAATAPLEDKTALVIFTRAGNKLSGTFVPTRNAHVSGFEWVNDERVVISIAEKFGMLDQPRPTGEIYAVNADGGQADLLVGFRVQGNGAGTRIQPKKVESVAAFLVDSLPADERNVVVSIWPMGQTEPFTRADRLDVNSGRRVTLASAPVRRADFTTDNTGEVRLAGGADTDNVSKLYYREARGSEWRLVSTEKVDGRIDEPLGFSADNTQVYLRVRSGVPGPDTIVAWDPASDKRTTVFRDTGADPWSIIYRNGTNIPLGALVMDGRHRSVFFDDSVPEARVYRSLEAAFPGQSVRVTSSTKDGQLLMVNRC